MFPASALLREAVEFVKSSLLIENSVEDKNLSLLQKSDDGTLSSGTVGGLS